MKVVVELQILESGRARDVHASTVGPSDRAGKGMRPQVGENCVKDTKEEDRNHVGRHEDLLILM